MRSVLVLLPAALIAQDWASYGGDPGGMKYSQLDQIDRGNVTQLEVAWEYDTGDSSDGRTEFPHRSAFATTPLVIDGRMYFTTPFHRLIAVEADTGKELWTFDSKLDRSQRVNLYTSRGAAYWKDGDRLFLGNQDGFLYSIDPATGEPDQRFGDNGLVDLKVGMMNAPGRLGLTSPVSPCGGSLVTGGWVTDSLSQGPSGDIRGIDARTGKVRWTFHTVPRPGEFGNDTWEGDSWKNRGGTNAWSIVSVDEARQMAFVPIG